MRRPIQHVEQDISFNIFGKAIPSEWIIRDIIPDYGLDKSVEIVENGEVSGKEVLVQIKSTKTVKISKGNVSYPLAVDNIKDYMKRDVPVILAVVDLTSEKVYWLFIQQYVYDVLNKIEWQKQGTVNVLVPLTNDLSLTLLKLKDIAFAGSTYLLSKKIDKTPVEHLEIWKSNSEAIRKLMEVSNKFSQTDFNIKFDVSYRYQMENDYEKSCQVLRQIAEEAKVKGDTNTYIKAILSIVYRSNPIKDNKQIFEQLNSIKDIVEKSNINAFKLMWKGDFLETVFANLLHKYNSTRILHLVASQSHDRSMAPFLGLEIAQIINAIFQIENDFISCLKQAYEGKEFFVYLDLLRRFAKMQYLWCYNNSLEGDKEAIYSQLKSIESTFLEAEKIAPKISPDILVEIYLDLARLYHSIEDKKLEGEYYSKASDLAVILQHKGLINAVKFDQQLVEKSFTIPYFLNFKKEQGEVTHEISDEEEEKMIKDLLRCAGIDINAQDELAELARIGLRDRNPERILKYCQNLHTEIVIYGPIWDMVSLPSTGTKLLFCEKKDIAMFGMQLDQLLERMKENCKTCQDISPREENWRWSHQWQRERTQPPKMQEYMKKFFNR